jgi:fatty-acyl-CoA synthase
MIDFDKFSKIDECIEFHCKENPQEHCLSIRFKGNWQTSSRKDFWSEVEKYTNLFLGAFEESCLILFIKSLDLSLLSAYIGAIKAGHFPAQLSPFSSKVSELEYQRKVNHILAITKAKGIFTDLNQAGKLPQIEGLTILTPESAINITSVVKNKSKIALIQFSSGSTGLQKVLCLLTKRLFLI